MHHIENVDYVIILVVIMIGLLLLLLGENIQNTAGGAFFTACNPDLRENNVVSESVLPDRIVKVSFNKCNSQCMTLTSTDLKGNLISEQTVCGEKIQTN